MEAQVTVEVMEMRADVYDAVSRASSSSARLVKIAARLAVASPSSNHGGAGRRVCCRKTGR